MRSSSIFSLIFTTLTALSVVSAGPGNMHNNRLNRRGHDAAVAERQLTNQKVKVLRRKDGSKKNKKRGGRTCKVRGTGNATAAADWNATATASDSASASASASVTSAASSTAWSSSAAWSAPSATYSSSSQAWSQWSSSSSSAPAPSSTQVWWTSSSSEAPASTSSSAPQPSATYTPPSGVISATGACGDCGATADHPNGSPEWLNCKLTEGGWVPPVLSASQLISITDPSLYPEVFGACLDYNDIFAEAAGQMNMPAALLMAIGMQESGCNKGAVGSRGEQGIMQVAGDACDNPSGSCQEPSYNINKGASILVGKMGGDPNGNIVEALGMYNGWMPGMQAGSGAEYGPQGQKVSYLDDMLNKWLQGKNNS